MLRAVLTHVETAASAASLFSCARAVAAVDDGAIDAAHFSGAPLGVLAAGADGFVAAAPELLRVAETSARRFAEEAEAAWRAAAGDDPVAWRWRQDLGEEGPTLGAAGRLYDLIVVGRPGEGASAPSAQNFETALFETGRPVLTAPPEPVSFDPAGHVVIAWNGGAETARALAMAAPILRRAKRISVVAVTEGMTPGPGGDALAGVLRKSRLEPTLVQCEAGGLSVGERVLERCAALEADLLIKGAYSQSRLRQLIFGGATSHILAHASLPVLWAA